MIIQWPRTQIREDIENIITQIGRDVEFFYVYSSSACPICSLDPITNTSVDSFCPVCSGEYWIDVFSGVTMSAHVTWKSDSQNEFVQGGQYFLGDAKVKVMHTPEREQLIQEVDYLIVDGKTMNPIKTTLLGTPINRIIVDVKEKSED